jgi:hypothetical protein
MYSCTDTFIHDDHIATLGDNASCTRCHAAGETAKTRSAATACVECHRAEIVEGFAEQRRRCSNDNASGDIGCAGCHGETLASVDGNGFDQRSIDGIAPGYRIAMHQLCVECHCVHEADAAVAEPAMTRCGFCHRGVESEIEISPGDDVGPKITVVARGFTP